MTVSIGVLIVNWNGAEDTVACLDSLLAADPGPVRVVVVDNFSADDSIARIQRWAREHTDVHTVIPGETDRAAPAWLTVVRAGRNLGFSGGNNAGLPLLIADPLVRDVLLLNNDATVSPEFFRRISEASGSDPRAGIIGPTIYRFPATHDIWFAGGRATPLRALVSHELQRPVSSEPRDTPFVTGCAMLVTGEALRRLGPLPDCYDPGYMEDAEYCWRAREAGFRVMYAPAAIAYHKVGASFRKIGSPAITFALNRNRVLFARRNLRGLERLGALGYLAATKPVRAVIELLLGRPAQAGAVLFGAVEGFRSAAGRRSRVTNASPA